MTHKMITYVGAIGVGFPGVFCSTNSDGESYEDIIWEGGDALPSKDTLDTFMLNYQRDHMWGAIKEERNRRTYEGGYKVGNYWFHSDAGSRIQQIGLVMMGAGLPANLMWKTLSGEFVLMTQTLAAQIFQTAAYSDTVIFSVAEQKRQAMLQSATPWTYDYLGGWPLIYGE